MGGLVIVALSGCVSSLPPVELALCLPLSPRSCCRWLVLRTATPPPRDPLAPSATLPRPPMLLSPRPTPASHLTCGRRLCSRSLPSRSSPTTWPRTTGSTLCRDRRQSSTDCIRLSIHIPEIKRF